MNNVFTEVLEELDVFLTVVGLMPDGGTDKIRSVTIRDETTNVTDMDGNRETKLNLFDEGLADKVDDLWKSLAAVLGHTTEWGEPDKFLHVESGHLVFISTDGDMSMARNSDDYF